MVQSTDPAMQQQALAYIQHQAAKSASDLAALMERTGDDCARCLEGVSDAQAGFSYGEEWSMKEVVGHMLGSGAVINREIGGLVADVGEGLLLNRGVCGLNHCLVPSSYRKSPCMSSAAGEREWR